MRTGRLGHRFFKNRRGAAAVEFALVVPLVLAMIFATLEAGWFMVQSIMLDRAVDLTVRELRIGSFENPTQERLRARICEQALVLINCEDSLALELVPIANPSSYPTDAARCVQRDTPVQPLLRFNVGQRSETVFVRACFIVEPMTPDFALGLVLSKDETGALRIVSRSAFINEPA
jgi:Flp pilus assembly pilin Flp